MRWPAAGNLLGRIRRLVAHSASPATPPQRPGCSSGAGRCGWAGACSGWESDGDTCRALPSPTPLHPDARPGRLCVEAGKGGGGGRRRGRPGRNACVGNKQKQSGHLSQGVASPTWFRGLLVHAGLVGGASELSKPLPGLRDCQSTRLRRRRCCALLKHGLMVAWYGECSPITIPLLNSTVVTLRTLRRHYPNSSVGIVDFKIYSGCGIDSSDNEILKTQNK